MIVVIFAVAVGVAVAGAAGAAAAAGVAVAAVGHSQGCSRRRGGGGTCENNHWCYLYCLMCCKQLSCIAFFLTLVFGI